MKKLLALVLALFIVLPAPATAQSVCAERTQMIEQLEERWGEIRHSAGLTGDDRVMEVFVNPETGTWTIIVTSPLGHACMIAAGEFFNLLLPDPGGDPV